MLTAIRFRLHLAAHQSAHRRYGGSLHNRCRYPLEVFAAMRAVWPAEKPTSVRISAHDWAPGGNTPEDAVEIAELFKDAGADMIDVSSGQTTRAAQPVYGRMYQTPFADRIRNEVGIATIAVGAIFEPDHVNSIIAAGRADLAALARPHLADPYWTLHAAAHRLPRHAVAATISPPAATSSTATSSAPRSCRKDPRPMASSLEGRHAVVTGGGRGIGAAVAEALAGAGARLTVMGRRRDALEAEAEKLRRNAPAQAIEVDVAEPTSVQRAFARAEQEFGPAAILINNAGQAASAPFQKTDMALWQRMLDVNLTGTFLCAQAALAGMLPSGYGRIVNIASIAGLAGAPMSPPIAPPSTASSG